MIDSRHKKKNLMLLGLPFRSPAFTITDLYNGVLLYGPLSTTFTGLTKTVIQRPITWRSSIRGQLK